MKEKYFPQEVEERWQRRWYEARSFESKLNPSKEEFYCLEMLPYPSGRLHMGHARNYSIGDALTRYKRMQGFNVLHPMGWDSFGQPAEQAAIKNAIHPAKWTEENIDNMRQQLKRLGFSYDWEREVASHTPEYYRWNQWFFLKMYDRGLIYRKRSPVNWCPKCRTVLSNEQAQGGCWRCGSEVEQRELEQWFARITQYAEELLLGLDELEATWPERVVTMQRNWIGRSEGALVDFAVEGTDEKVFIFTTRVDTIFGSNAVILAPEHPLVPKLVEIIRARRKQADQKIGAMKVDGDSWALPTYLGPREDDIVAFVERMTKTDRRVRSAQDTEKEGIDTGLIAINPYNNERLPIWIANFILMDYGSGAIMSVPAHDERDLEFAKKFGLPIRQVVAPLDENGRPVQFDRIEAAYEDEGVLINSGQFDGLSCSEGIRRMTAHAKAKGFGEASVHYKLRDWGLSRQRYWGTPIPIIHCPRCGIVPVPEDQLPVLLPKEAPFTGESGSPLEHVPEFVNTDCPKCKGRARRDTDTMDTFVDSSWYYFRYCDPRNESAPFDSNVIRYWMPVDLYIGGVEHAVMHLLYTRFWARMMRDLGLIQFSEPVRRLLSQGMVTNIVTEGPRKGQWLAMSKSLGNGVYPDEMISIYGADTVRLFVLFAAPPEAELRWQEDGVEGAARFLRRIHMLVWKWHRSLPSSIHELGVQSEELTPRQRELLQKLHQTIKGVTRDIEERLQFNTAIAKQMELLNEITDFDRTIDDPESAPAGDRSAIAKALQSLILMLAPFAPHFAEEMWEALGHPNSLLDEAWPAHDDAFLVEDQLEIPVQVNGKLRSLVFIPAQASESDYEKAALAEPKIKSLLDGKQVVRVIVIPRRMINVVVH